MNFMPVSPSTDVNQQVLIKIDEFSRQVFARLDEMSEKMTKLRKTVEKLENGGSGNNSAKSTMKSNLERSIIAKLEKKRRSSKVYQFLLQCMN